MWGSSTISTIPCYYSLTTRRTLKWWKKVFWRLIDICVLNSWVIYRSNFPDSTINTHKLFRLKLIEELVQPLLTLRASPECPPHLHTKGREPVATDSRLLGKHFSCKHSKHQRCAVCSQKKSPATGKRRDTKLKTIAPSAMFSSVLGNVLKHIIHRRVRTKSLCSTLCMFKLSLAV